MPEPDIDTPLVSRLIAAQFPRWAGLPITRVPSAGTDNAIYRLGDDMAVRLPRRPWVAATLTREQDWLPRLAPFLPLAVPVRFRRQAIGAGRGFESCRAHFLKNLFEYYTVPVGGRVHGWPLAGFFAESDAVSG